MILKNYLVNGFNATQKEGAVSCVDFSRKIAGHIFAGLNADDKVRINQATMSVQFD